VFPRGPGVESMDIDLTVRIFMQKRVVPFPGLKPTAFRFFAQNGSILSGHVSVLQAFTPSFGLTYTTVKDVVVEESTKLFVNRINYTGFASAWWVHDLKEGPMLIDFNPRLERHACLAPILSGPSKLLDPCIVFQRIASGHHFDSNSFPFMVPAGYTYADPLRLTQSKRTGSFGDRSTTSDWNIRLDDERLMFWILDKWSYDEDPCHA
jgi:hypothetical protein